MRLDELKYILKMKFLARIIFLVSSAAILAYVYNACSDDFIQMYEYFSFAKKLILKPKCLFSYNIAVPDYMNVKSKAQIHTVNACIFVLLMNKDLCDLITTIIQFEKNFNHKYNYPYVLMSDEEFTDEFKATIQKYTRSKIEFGFILREEWMVPEWIDEPKLVKSIDTIGKNTGYRHLCRYYSGFFFRHELTLKYEYYMRLDPHVNFPCEIKEDPFLKMVKNNISYGFVLAAPEALFTIPTLWENIKEWKTKNLKETEIDEKALSYISEDNGETLSNSLCMFYNNFEMGAFSLFRNEKYLSYFNHLDQSKGFYHERWVSRYFKVF